MALQITHKGRHLCIGQLPGRKRPSLYWWTALDIVPIASFRSEHDAEQVKQFFEDLVETMEEERDGQ